MNERHRGPQISPPPSLPPLYRSSEIYVGVGRGFYQSGRHSCASTRRPGVAVEQVLIRLGLGRISLPPPPFWPLSYPSFRVLDLANVRRGNFFFETHPEAKFSPLNFFHVCICIYGFCRGFVFTWKYFRANSRTSIYFVLQIDDKEIQKGFEN